MPKLNAYLAFDGTCAEAMKFYARVLDAKLDALITYGQMPSDEPTPAAVADRVMHAYLVHKEFSLMAGDTPPGRAVHRHPGRDAGARVIRRAAEGRRLFAALSRRRQRSRCRWARPSGPIRSAC